MSAFDYERSKALVGEPFYALIMAAMRGADTINLDTLKAMWPDVFSELEARYSAPYGLLPHERKRRIAELEQELLNFRHLEGTEK